jgi:hypothetical protein
MRDRGLFIFNMGIYHGSLFCRQLAIHTIDVRLVIDMVHALSVEKFVTELNHIADIIQAQVNRQIAQWRQQLEN